MIQRQRLVIQTAWSAVKQALLHKKTRTHKSSLLDLHTCIVTTKKYPKFKIILVSNYIWFWCWELRNQILNLYVLQRKIPNSKMIRLKLHMVLMLQNKKSKNQETLWNVFNIVFWQHGKQRHVCRLMKKQRLGKIQCNQGCLWKHRLSCILGFREGYAWGNGEIYRAQPGTVWESTCYCLLHSVAAKVLTDWSTTEAVTK